MDIFSDFDTIIDRRGTSSLKWERYQDPGLIPMWVADMDFAAPPPVLDALRRRVSHGVFGYTVTSETLVTELCQRFSERYAFPVEADWFEWLPGVVPGFTAACMAFSEPGDEIITFTPVYPPFLQAPPQVGRKLVTVPLVREHGHYTFDLDAFEAAITPRTRMLLLCHPHNPVGRVFSEEELRGLAAVCLKHNVLICSDEIHCDLILNGTPHRPMASLAPEVAARTVTLMSPGKTFNTAGLNLGFAVISDDALRRKFHDARQLLLPFPNALALTACLAAYRDSKEWHGRLLQVLRRNSEVVLDFVRTELAPVRMDPVEATYLAWFDLREIGDPAIMHRLRQAGVALSDGRPFDGAGFARLNFGCPMPTLMAGLERISKALNV